MNKPYRITVTNNKGKERVTHTDAPNRPDACRGVLSLKPGEAITGVEVIERVFAETTIQDHKGTRHFRLVACSWDSEDFPITWYVEEGHHSRKTSRSKFKWTWVMATDAEVCNQVHEDVLRQALFCLGHGILGSLAPSYKRA
jgi:hypothetical protein